MIGGDEPGAGNLISGNMDNGIDVASDREFLVTGNDVGFFHI